jgi:hypothetical protein
MKHKSETAWVVIMYCAVIAIAMLIQAYITGALGIALPAALAMTSASQVADVIPHALLAWGFATICSGYTIADRAALTKRTYELEYGNKDMGNTSQMRLLIFLSLALVSQAIFLSTFLAVPGLDVNGLAAAFIGVTTSYTVGNKAIKFAASNHGMVSPAQGCNAYASTQYEEMGQNEEMEYQK